jgi:agmatinase
MPTTLPENSLKRPRFCGINTFMRLPHTTDLTGVDAAVIGIPFDTGSPYRIGCRFAPAAARAISVMLRPYNPYHRINVFEAASFVDYGDATVNPGVTEESFALIEADLAPIVEQGVIPLGIGGDHSVTLPQLRILASRHGALSILHFDAHTDTWDSYLGQKYNAGTAFRRGVEEGLIDAKNSIQIGMRGSLFSPEDIDQSLRLGYEIITTDQIYDLGIPAVIARIREKLGSRKVFISFDNDFVDPAFAPGIQTPESGGPTAREAYLLLRGLGGLNIAGADVVELNPSFDQSQITALFTATVMSEIMALIAISKTRA